MEDRLFDSTDEEETTLVLSGNNVLSVKRFVKIVSNLSWATFDVTNCEYVKPNNSTAQKKIKFLFKMTRRNNKTQDTYHANIQSRLQAVPDYCGLDEDETLELIIVLSVTQSDK